MPCVVCRVLNNVKAPTTSMVLTYPPPSFKAQKTPVKRRLPPIFSVTSHPVAPGFICSNGCGSGCVVVPVGGLTFVPCVPCLVCRYGVLEFRFNPFPLAVLLHQQLNPVLAQLQANQPRPRTTRVTIQTPTHTGGTGDIMATDGGGTPATPDEPPIPVATNAHPLGVLLTNWRVVMSASLPDLCAVGWCMCVCVPGPGGVDVTVRV